MKRKFQNVRSPTGQYLPLTEENKKMAGKKNHLDPRQMDFLKRYFSPSSETYGNAYKSAIDAGFGEEYSRKIMCAGNEWVSDPINQRKVMLVKAENNLKEALELQVKDENGQINPFLLREKNRTSEFIAKTLGKEHYSEKLANEDDNGNSLLVPLIDSIKKIAEKN